MIMSKENGELIVTQIIQRVKAIIKGMGIGSDNCRDVGDTKVFVRVTRVDSNVFHVARKDGSAFVHGVQAAATSIGHLLLSDAWLADDIPTLMLNLTAHAQTLSADDAEAIAAAKTPDDGAAAMRREKTLAESDQDHLLKRLRRVEKAAIEGVVSRKAIITVIERLEDRIENKYSPDAYEMLYGAVDVLKDIFGI